MSPADLLKLARPKQWAKNIFVMLGPLYGMRDHPDLGSRGLLIAALAAVAFSLASSCVYIVNDVMDRERDKFHPRKCKRPIASGAVSVRAGLVFAAFLAVAAGACCALVPVPGRIPLLAVVTLYVVNVCAYSMLLKKYVVLDVLSLSMGFVLRVVGGCVAVAITPSTWLLNVTLFLAMFLAFGKRLGERRTLGESAASARGVQSVYTDDILRMFVVVSAVATLITYAFYVQSKDPVFTAPLPGFSGGVNVLWLTLIPALYALARAIMLIERGQYDDPTELASKDPPTQLAALVFAACSIAAAVIAQSVSS
jgi:decaprenyl-phosphate phosphoribosyltransferase